MRLRAAFLPVTTLLSISAVTIAAWAAPAISDSDVKFQAKGPAGLNIDGTAGSLVVGEIDGKLTFGVSAQTLKTGVDLRDTHLRKYLGVDKSPVITMKVDRAKISTKEGEAVEGTATGELTLNGVTKAQSFTYKVLKSGDKAQVQALLDVNINDYKVETPCYLGVCVDPKVKVKVKFKLTD